MISRATEAALLLTAPLKLKKSDKEVERLTPSKFRKLEEALRAGDAQPADLLGPDSAELLRLGEQALDGFSLEPLLNRGFRLASAVEQWEARSIRVYSPSDPEYPELLKQQPGVAAPPILYCCGALPLPDGPGLAIVGSRSANEQDLAFTAAAAALTANAGCTVVSGGARGIDRAAMDAALDAGGKVIGVLADNLQDSALSGGYRDALATRRLTLLSEVDPLAGFNVGNAMARNRLIYALASAALVVVAELKKGGTWEGAIYHLNKKGRNPIYVRRPGTSDRGLSALVENGARIWSDPAGPDELRALLTADIPAIQSSFDLG